METSVNHMKIAVLISPIIKVKRVNPFEKLMKLLDISMAIFV